MAESIVERLRRQALESKKAETAFRSERLETETRTCPGCGAGRAEAHGVKECRYCGHVFIAADI